VEDRAVDEKTFWRIVDSTLPAADDREEQESLLWDKLVGLQPQEVAEFAWLFDDMINRAERGNGREAWLKFDGVGADDGFWDFRCWLVSRGRAVYEATLRDPKSLRAVVAEDEDLHFGDFGYASWGVYEQLTGEELPDRPAK
jgi:hypothetical protein